MFFKQIIRPRPQLLLQFNVVKKLDGQPFGDVIKTFNTYGTENIINKCLV
jgi:hypothetical protein